MALAIVLQASGLLAAKIGCRLFNRALLHASYPCSIKQSLGTEGDILASIAELEKMSDGSLPVDGTVSVARTERWVFKKYEQSWYGAHCIEVSRWII